MALIAALTNTDIGKTIMTPTDTMGNMVKGAQVGQLNQQTQAGYQEQAIKQNEFQRQQQLRNVYAQSGPDQNTLIHNLYGAGFGEEASKLHAQQSEERFRAANAQYLTGMEDTRAKTQQLTELQAKSTMAGGAIYQFQQAAPDLFRTPEKYAPIDITQSPQNLDEYSARLQRIQEGREITPEILGSYQATYRSIPDSLRDKVLTPDQFKNNPSIGISLMKALAGESSEYQKKVQEAFKVAHDQFDQSGKIYTPEGAITPSGVTAPEGGAVNLTEVARHNRAMEEKQRLEEPQKQKKDDEKTALTLAQHINELSASSRSLLGVAATNNMKSDRALALLQDPNMDVTQKDAAVTDFLSVMKQGSPDEQMLKRGMYGSAYERGLQLAQSVSGQPMQYKDKAVVDKLVKMFQEFKNIDNKVVDDNLGVYAAAARGFIARNQDQWNQMAGAVKGSYTPTAAPGAAAPAGTPVQGGHKAGDTRIVNGVVITRQADGTWQ